MKKEIFLKNWVKTFQLLAYPLVFSINPLSKFLSDIDPQADNLSLRLETRVQ